MFVVQRTCLDTYKTVHCKYWVSVLTEQCQYFSGTGYPPCALGERRQVIGIGRKQPTGNEIQETMYNRSQNLDAKPAKPVAHVSVETQKYTT